MSESRSVIAASRDKVHLCSPWSGVCGRGSSRLWGYESSACVLAACSAEAESIIAESDADPLLYDLVINTGEIALETATELIVRAVEAKFPQVLQARQATAPVSERLAVAEQTP